jgi:hypothetical protein
MLKELQHDMHNICYASLKVQPNPDDLGLMSCGEFLDVCCTFKFTSTHEVVKVLG